MPTPVNSGQIQIITTQDGSHSLFNPALNETYHSVHGAIQESIHVFIKNGLSFLVGRSNPDQINILEMGFGTGLNALLTLQESLKKKNRIYYTTVEAFPLEREIWSSLNYTNSLGQKTNFESLHTSAWGEWTSVSENFNLLKLAATLEEITVQKKYYDLIYYDAFAPNKQPELWTLDVLRKVTDSLKSDGVFVTYCAKGQLKRDLKDLGLVVETLPGPPGKKEMVRAIR